MLNPLADRFDLATGRLVTMSFSHQEKSLIDGRESYDFVEFDLLRVLTLCNWNDL